MSPTLKPVLGPRGSAMAENAVWNTAVLLPFLFVSVWGFVIGFVLYGLVFPALLAWSLHARKPWFPTAATLVYGTLTLILVAIPFLYLFSDTPSSFSEVTPWMRGLLCLLWLGEVAAFGIGPLVHWNSVWKSLA